MSSSARTRVVAALAAAFLGVGLMAQPVRVLGQDQTDAFRQRLQDGRGVSVADNAADDISRVGLAHGVAYVTFTPMAVSEGYWSEWPDTVSALTGMRDVVSLDSAGRVLSTYPGGAGDQGGA